MADRYQDRPFPAHDDYGRGSDQHGQKGESDPLAELARLIGQTDPFAMGRGNVKPPPQPAQRYQEPQYDPEPYEAEAYEPEPEVPAGPPPWMQRANARTQQPAAPPPQPQYDDEPEYAPSPVHPLHRYGAQPAPQQPPQQAHYQYPEDQQYADEEPADPSRYDDALYGQLEAGQDYQRDPAYPDDPYAYQGYDEEAEEQPRRRGGMITVAAVLALAVIGTGGAFAYRSFVGTPRSGEPPVIKADNSPTKVVPAQSDNSAKAPDRMTFGDGNEKLVPREESPVDINARSGPRVVFPPLNQNANPPSPASVSPSAPPPASASNGTLPNNEPRRIRTLSVKGDAADAGMPAAAPGAKQPPAAPAQVAAPKTQATPLSPPPGAPSRNPPTSANASANAPLSLNPQGGAAPAPATEPPARVAAVAPAPAAAPSSGGFVVQVSSQKTEADAQASYKALQGKFPTVLGSRPPLIKRADLGEKGVFYRAMVGPFGSRDEAVQVCTNLKAAGGQCVIQGN
jgi:cell division septation protein DedD